MHTEEAYLITWFNSLTCGEKYEVQEGPNILSVAA